MKIYPGSEIKQIITIQKKPPTDTAPNTTRTQEGDKVAFSKQLQQVQGMEKHFSPDSDRNARLQLIKQQIADGTYAPDTKEVAVSILKYIVEGNSNG